MKYVVTVLAAAATLVLGACTRINTSAQASHPASSATSARPAPTVTKTIIKRRSKPAIRSPAQAPAQAPVQAPVQAPPSAAPNVTDPWAVVSAYYGDIESGNYAEAWTLLSSGMVTGQTYRQFVAGFSCTGSQLLTELGESGDTVRFDLAATDDCNGRVQHFTGADTVVDGKIVAADVTRTG